MSDRFVDPFESTEIVSSKDPLEEVNAAFRRKERDNLLRFTSDKLNEERKRSGILWAQARGVQRMLQEAICRFHSQECNLSAIRTYSKEIDQIAKELSLVESLIIDNEEQIKIIDTELQKLL